MIGVAVGNYVIAEKIGEGGMGVVYRAAHQTLGRQVAIKVLHGDSHRAPELVSRFFNEAKAATEIRNDHIIDVLDFGQTPDGRPYIVMEWLEGQTLSAALTGGRVLDVPRTLGLLAAIGEALAAAHELGVVHRDLKPDNIFLQRKGNRAEFVKVLDFGIAKLLLSDGPSDFKTRSGMLLGTPAYMSPEQCRGARDIDHRSDIYALGVIAYQMLTGRLPFTADGLGELIYKHMSEAPVPPATIQPALGDGLSAAILKALAKEPADRFARVEDFVEALHQGAGLVVPATELPSGAVSNATGGGAPSGRVPAPAVSVRAATEIMGTGPGGTLHAPPPSPSGGPAFSTTLSPAELVYRRPWSRHPATIASSAVVLGLLALAGGWALRGNGRGTPQVESPSGGAASLPAARGTSSPAVPRPSPAPRPTPAPIAAPPARVDRALRPDAGAPGETPADSPARTKPTRPGVRPVTTPVRKGAPNGPAVYRGMHLEIEREFP